MTFEISSFRAAPDGLGRDGYDIAAKTARDDAAFGATEPNSMTDSQRKTYSESVRERLRTLLEEHNRRERRSENEGCGSRGQGSSGDTRHRTRPPAGLAITMERLAIYLGTISGRPASDRTALTGEFDWTLGWVPDGRAIVELVGGPVRHFDMATSLSPDYLRVAAIITQARAGQTGRVLRRRSE
jgi:hypothetical protein